MWMLFQGHMFIVFFYNAFGFNLISVFGDASLYPYTVIYMYQEECLLRLQNRIDVGYDSSIPEHQV